MRSTLDQVRQRCRPHPGHEAEVDVAIGSDDKVDPVTGSDDDVDLVIRSDNEIDQVFVVGSLESFLFLLHLFFLLIFCFCDVGGTI